MWNHSVISDSLWPHGLEPTTLLHPWDFPGKDTGVGCHFLLQGIFLTQGSNSGLLHCRQTLYPLSYQGIPCGCRQKKTHTHPVRLYSYRTKNNYNYIWGYILLEDKEKVQCPRNWECLKAEKWDRQLRILNGSVYHMTVCSEKNWADDNPEAFAIMLYSTEAKLGQFYS